MHRGLVVLKVCFQQAKGVGLLLFIISLYVYKVHLSFYLISVLITTMGGGPVPGFGPGGSLATHRPDSLVCLQASSDILSSRKPSPLAQSPTDVPKK